MLIRKWIKKTEEDQGVTEDEDNQDVAKLLISSFSESLTTGESYHCHYNESQEQLMCAVESIDHTLKMFVDTYSKHNSVHDIAFNLNIRWPALKHTLPSSHVKDMKHQPNTQDQEHSPYELFVKTNNIPFPSVVISIQLFFQNELGVLPEQHICQSYSKQDVEEDHQPFGNAIHQTMVDEIYLLVTSIIEGVLQDTPYFLEVTTKGKAEVLTATNFLH